MSENIIFGGGCFWCVEAALKKMKGINAIMPGYAGGHLANPTYEQVCTGTTGHAEVVRVTFNPEIISLDDLLQVFFILHDPTTLNRQGNDVGTQYRSVIYYASKDQKASAEHVIQDMEAKQLWPAPIVTELAPLSHFWPAEPLHQDYFTHNPNTGYCSAIIAPKVSKMRRIFSDRYQM